jgi:rod shape-determining protein MreC
MKPSKKELKLFNDGQSPIFSFIILLLISFSLMGLDYRKKIHHHIKNESSFLIKPIVYVINLPKNINESLTNLFKTKSQLFEKNLKLENKIIDLSIENQRLILIEAENRQLRKTIKISNNIKITTIDAEIILPKIRNGTEIITINKGFNDSIKIGQPVINNLGLVGQIIFTGNSFSEVNPITSKKYIVPAIFEKATDNIIVRGNGNKYLEVLMFPAHRKVKIGAILMTSGIDSLYPKGIKIGQVIKVTPQINNQFNHLLISPFSQPTTHTQVRVFMKKEND